MRPFGLGWRHGHIVFTATDDTGAHDRTVPGWVKLRRGWVEFRDPDSAGALVVPTREVFEIVYQPATR